MKINKNLKKYLRISGIGIIVLLTLFFIIRNPLLHYTVDKVAAKINERTGANLTVGRSAFTGFSEVSMYDISLVPFAGDTLFTADTVSVNLSVWTLFRATIRINRLHASGIKATISCRNDTCNYQGFVNQKKIDNSNGTRVDSNNISEKNYGALLHQLLDRSFNFAPQRADIRDAELIYRNDTLERIISVDRFHSDDKSMTGTFEDKTNEVVWQCNGIFSQRKHLLNLSIYPVDTTRKILPLLPELAGLSSGFDTLHIELLGYRWSNNELTAEGNFLIRNLTVYHKKIADDTVKITSAAFNFNFKAGKNYFEVDSSSKASLAEIKIYPFLKFESDSSKTYTLKLRTDKTPSTAFFNSLPEGMFDEVRGITADGTLSFKLDFKLNSAVPDSVLFDVSMKKEKFRIRSAGSSGIYKMNDEFLHSVYERDRLVRVFPVGPSNPAYTPLDKISPDFINAVITSEDGSFFYHNGFNEEAFRKSIAANFKQGKFVRGGSTISMQLVKNVFLTRKKTVARKAEEALLVWLIESNRIYSKERMLEVYMNIIELGPDVYGIGEASSFYFGKKPAELDLPEGIFLASLLPHPKWFKYSFDTLGNLKPFLAGYYRIVSDFMLRKELITQEQHDQLQPVVILKGPARNLVVPTDTILREEEFIEHMIDR